MKYYKTKVMFEVEVFVIEDEREPEAGDSILKQFVSNINGWSYSGAKITLRELKEVPWQEANTNRRIYVHNLPK